MSQMGDNDDTLFADDYSKTTFGFWIYLLTDFMFLSTLFASYLVLSKNTSFTLTPRHFFSLPFSTIQAIVLLCSAFTIGIASTYVHKKNCQQSLLFFFLTFFIGLLFLAMMGHEFSSILSSGYSWKSTAFFSIYFTLIGMMGLHVFFGLFWMIVLMVPLFKQGVTQVSIKRWTCLKMFWQFINFFWVLIFTFVYVLGVL